MRKNFGGYLPPRKLPAVVSYLDSHALSSRDRWSWLLQSQETVREIETERIRVKSEGNSTSWIRKERSHSVTRSSPRKNIFFRAILSLRKQGRKDRKAFWRLLHKESLLNHKMRDEKNNSTEIGSKLKRIDRERRGRTRNRNWMRRRHERKKSWENQQKSESHLERLLYPLQKEE
jgi:hypothetical protein